MNHQDTNYHRVVDEADLDTYRSGSIPEIFQLVERLGHKLRNIRRQSVAIAGLTPQQYVVLGVLGKGDRRPLKELAEAAHCTRATMTGIVDGLERRGLVSRLPNPDDRRSLLVALTETGKNLQQDTPTLEEMLHGCCTGLHPDQARQLAGLLNALDRSLNAWEPAT